MDNIEMYHINFPELDRKTKADELKAQHSKLVLPANPTRAILEDFFSCFEGATSEWTNSEKIHVLYILLPENQKIVFKSSWQSEMLRSVVVSVVDRVMPTPASNALRIAIANDKNQKLFENIKKEIIERAA